VYLGSCVCGEVELVIQGGIHGIIHCHCSRCRKNSGTAYATNGFVNVNEFTLTKGKDSLAIYSTNPGRKRHFCQKCGSSVYSSNDQDPSRNRIRLGILDSDIIERPISHNFVTSKANWEDLDVDLPRNEEFEIGRA